MLQSQLDARVHDLLATAAALSEEGRAAELRELVAELDQDRVPISADDRLALGTSLIVAYGNVQDHVAAQAAVDELHALVPAARRHRQARFYAVAAFAAQGVGNQERAVDLGIRVLALVDDAAPDEDAAPALGNCAIAFANMQLFPLAVEVGQRGVEAAVAAGLPPSYRHFQLGYVYLSWAIRLEHLGLPEESRSRWAEAIDQLTEAIEADNLPVLFRAWAAAWRAACLARTGRLDTAQSDLESARSLPVEPPNAFVQRSIAHASASLLLAEGRLPEARTELLAQWRPTVEAGLPVWTEDVAWLLGQVALAERNDAEALLWHREMHERYGRAQYEAWLSRATAARLRIEQQALLRRTRELESDVMSDALTGVPNRRAFDVNLPRLIAAAHAGNAPLTLALIDIDHFKLVNDSYGHQVGDEVLRRIARILREQSREADRCARYGGDELALCVAAEAPEASVAVGRISRRIADYPWATIVPGLAVTVSTGLAELRPGDTATTLFWAADQSLLAAKRARPALPTDPSNGAAADRSQQPAVPPSRAASRGS